MRCKEKEEFVLANYKTMTYKEIGEKLGIKNRTVQYYLTKNGIRKMERELTDTEIAFIKDNYKNMTYKEIANLFGLSEKHIRGRINNMKMPKNRKFNNDYFHNIDSDIKAYFLGFIFADGWIVNNPVKRKYEFSIQLSSCDKYILDKLNEELGNVHQIIHHEPYVSEINGITTYHKSSDVLRIYSKSIVEDLISHGIVENKSKKDNYPIIGDSLFFDFLRGYIDGDGCYYHSSSNKNVYLHITCGSAVPLKWIKDKLSEYEITTNVYQEKERKYRLTCTNYPSMKKLVSLLYHPNFSLCLTRKYNKIKFLLNGLAI